MDLTPESESAIPPVYQMVHPRPQDRNQFSLLSLLWYSLIEMVQVDTQKSVAQEEAVTLKSNVYIADTWISK